MIDEKDLYKLASIIIANIKEEFALKHLSGNLVKTIKVENLGNQINIIIPAEIYDILEYKKTKVIRYTGKGSYASSLDEKSENHTGYVDRVINKSLEEWKSLFSNATIKREDF